MLSIKKFTKRILYTAILFAFAVVLSVSTAFAAPSNEVYLGGFAAGFLLNTQTVEIIGVCEVLSEDGLVCPARESGLKTGDIISKVNDIEVTSAEQLNKLLNDNFTNYNLSVMHEGEQRTVNIKPVKEKSSGKKRFGLLVKDSLNGIGTVTYIDKTNNYFAALGHPVSDNSGNLIKINGGSVYGCLIYDVKKGLRGNPGELKGVFENNNMIGTVQLNCACGIYGNISQELDTSKLTKIKMGSIEEASIGKAKIYSSLSENNIGEYDISIVKVDANNKDNRNFVIKIDDKDLIDKTGGIVQGMSGSPIVQNGKLIGAVTHVFVNDPTRGYGISIENMASSY